MILVPQRLFTAATVQVIARDGNNCLLYKQLTVAQQEREAYVANHVVSIVLSGRQVIRTYEDNTITASAGEAILLSRGVYYITDLLPSSKAAFRSLLFYFNDEAIHLFLSTVAVTQVNRDEAPDHLKIPANSSLAAFADNNLRLAADRLFTQPLLYLKTQELLHLLYGLVGNQTFAKFLFRLTLPKHRSLRQFMERNYTKPLGVEDYAYLTGRSVSSFRRDFRDQFGTTPNKWLRRQRMHQAVALLNTGEFSVTELSYSVGYENISYFIREFRKVTGLSPKQYMLTRRKAGGSSIDA
ncbi:MAG: AraC family transcriptional regulator [Bacteroidota bacterium]